MNNSIQHDSLKSNFPYDWYPANKENHPHDNLNFDVDLGAGRLPREIRVALQK